jgi:hypothetical protein
MFLEVPFHCPPKELNEVEFTMKLREEDGQVTGFLNYFLNKRLLLLKVGLKLKYAFAATCLRVSVTLLALSTKILDIESTLKEHIFDALWLIREIGMISGINHQLRDFCAIGRGAVGCGATVTVMGYKPTISQPSLFSTWVHIHVCG